jgi:outer membrane protein assembly factor BamB
MEREMVYIGIKGTVVGLDSMTGAEIWRRDLRTGSSFVTVSQDAVNVYAAANGEIYCMDKLTGTPRWQNPLKGLGTGLVTIASTAGSSSSDVPPLAEKHREDEAAASAVIIP